MTPIKEFGECLITLSENDYFFRPSFANMSRIGDPREIVQAFYNLHNDEPAQLIQKAEYVYGSIPTWLIEHISRPESGVKALGAAIDVLQACCDDDVTPLTGEIVPGRSGKWAFVWRRGKIPVSEMIIIAQSLITHGIIGKASVRQLQRHESGSMTDTFNSSDYINAARHHFSMSREEAERLTMTEFILLLNAKYPQQQGFTREEYYSVVDDYYAMKQQRLSR